MADPKPAEARELPFDHEGHRFRVTASPGLNGYELSLWRDEAPVREIGYVSWKDIRNAVQSGFHGDLIGGAMDTIRDAVLTGNVRDPEPPKFDDGH